MTTYKVTEAQLLSLKHFLVVSYQVIFLAIGRLALTVPAEQDGLEAVSSRSPFASNIVIAS